MITSNVYTLFNEAKKQKGIAYAPYSNFHVGAALTTKDGKMFSGCNVENRSSGMTICAERNAIFHMISSGYKNPLMMVLTSDIEDQVTYPCGACLQVLSEFNKEMTIVCTDATGKLFEIFKVNELLNKC